MVLPPSVLATIAAAAGHGAPCVWLTAVVAEAWS